MPTPGGWTSNRPTLEICREEREEMADTEKFNSSEGIGSGGGGGKKLSKFEAEKKRRRAHDNTKWRCKKAGPSSTPQFLYASYQDFCLDIQPPERSDHTLDRIDPNGHYAPGNVRWANKSVQSANKKGFRFGSFAAVEDIERAVRTEVECTARRSETANHWNRIIAAYRGETSFRAALDGLAAIGMRNAFADQKPIFWDRTLENCPVGYPGSYRLPSLTRYGQIVRVRAKAGLLPGNRLQLAMREQPSGVGVFTRQDLGFDMNLPARLAGLLDTAPKVGEIWTPPERAAADPVSIVDLETMMIAAGMHFFAKGFSVSIVPALTALKYMATASGEAESWGPLDRHVLVIPDFQVSGSTGWQSTFPEIIQLTKLIETRCENGRPTFIGIENWRDIQSQFKQLLKLLDRREVESKPHFSLEQLAARDQQEVEMVRDWKKAHDAWREYG